MLDPLEHALYQVANASLRDYPSPHVWVEEVFPWDYYYSIRAHLAQATRFEEMPEYPGRQFSNDLPTWAIAFFSQQRWQQAICLKFGISPTLTGMIRWTRDVAGYQLAPHTDAQKKVFTALFYMSEVEQPHGTSFYTPKDYKTASDGTAKYPREDFLLARMFPFKPNCMLGMLRTNDSWHGVEPITEPGVRDILFYTLNR